MWRDGFCVDFKGFLKWRHNQPRRSGDDEDEKVVVYLLVHYYLKYQIIRTYANQRSIRFTPLDRTFRNECNSKWESPGDFCKTHPASLWSEAQYNSEWVDSPCKEGEENGPRRTETYDEDYFPQVGGDVRRFWRSARLLQTRGCMVHFYYQI